MEAFFTQWYKNYRYIGDKKIYMIIEVQILQKKINFKNKKYKFIYRKDSTFFIKKE